MGCDIDQYATPLVTDYGSVASVTEWGWDNKGGHGSDTDIKCLPIKGSF